MNFEKAPSTNEFATGRLPGAGTDYLDTAALGAAVTAIEAAEINQALPTSSSIPPTTSTAGFVYNRVWQLIQSRPAGVAAVVLKATLRNDTGAPVSWLQVNYDLQVQSTNFPGELPGHYVYFSLTGAAGSWAKVDQLCGVDTVGRHSASISLPSWAPGAELFIIWVDDNTASNADPSYTLNHFSFVSSSEAMDDLGGISIGEGGTEVLTFDEMPSTLEWSTLSIAGLSMDIETAAELDARVQTLDATNVNQALGISTAYPPSGNNLAKWSTAWHFLATRPTGNAYQVMMATLKNHTGRALESVQLSYTLNDVIAQGTTNAEQVAGQRVFFSQTGAPNSWQLIPELSTGQTGSLTASLQLGSWPDGGSLFVLWADDNSNADANNQGLEEGAYIIDDLVVAPPIRLRLTRTFGTQAFLLWPRPAVGYQLEERAGWDLPWQPALGMDNPIGGFHTVSIGLGGPSKFFRLNRF